VRENGSAWPPVCGSKLFKAGSGRPLQRTFAKNLCSETLNWPAACSKRSRSSSGSSRRFEAAKHKEQSPKRELKRSALSPLPIHERKDTIIDSFVDHGPLSVLPATRLVVMPRERVVIPTGWRDLRQISPFGSKRGFLPESTVSIVEGVEMTERTFRIFAPHP
jgi:hypothetical protein